MHLAVCDDNIADRKQMERLLGRESDRRLNTTGVLYVDSFGNRSAILSTPMIYDGLFMDMVEDGCNAAEIARELRNAGNTLPIIFCCSKINYREETDLPDNCFFMDKPIQPAELTEVVETLLTIKNSQEKRMEFRTDTEAFYLTEEEIMYAYPDDRHVRIHLANGGNRECVANMLNFSATLGFDIDYSARGTTKLDLGFIRVSESGLLAMIGCSAVINLKYVDKVSAFHLTMTDGHKIKIAPSSKKALRQMAAEMKE